MLTEIPQAQRDRLAFIDLRLRFIGELQRHDVVNRFSVQAAAATRDLTLYKDLAPTNLDYDRSAKAYVRGVRFRPVFDFAPEQVLAWLSRSFGDTQPLQTKTLVTCEASPVLDSPDLEMLSVVTRAMYAQRSVEVAYRSLTSGLTTRGIVPLALADNGYRWHLRAFDRRSAQFRDFVLARIADARMGSEDISDHERPNQDDQWNRIVDMELVPHPANVQHPDTIEAEYRMDEGVLRFKVRAALAGYMLRRWNVDCTEDHSLKGTGYHLWLRNRQALYGVTNLVLAPGYEA